MDIELTNLANDSHFPGNGEALTELVKQLRTGRLIALTGAGTSVPLAPTWPSLLQDLAKLGREKGFLSAQDEEMLCRQIADDPLEVASSLEDAFGQQVFRSEISSKFQLEGRSTVIQDLLITLPVSSYVTFNYDDGLSTAYVRKHTTLPRIIRPDDRYDLHRWATDSSAHGPKAIVHWHGVAAAPDRMILTAEDYNRLYSVKENTTFIEELWRTKSLLVVGFGFRDPFLTRLAEGVLRNAPANSQHCALIGRSDSQPLTPLLRRQFAKKYRVNPVFYRIKLDANGHEDHSELSVILAGVVAASASATTMPAPARETGLATETPAAIAERELKAGLFVGPNGHTLYVEPRLMLPAASKASEDSDDILVDTASIAKSGQHYLISAPMEAGATTLARRLVVEFLRAGISATIRDATTLPKHKKGLQNDKFFSPSTDGRAKALILDRFDPVNHERTIKEICGLNCFNSIIILTRADAAELLTFKDLKLEVSFIDVSLLYLARSDIRSLATDLYDTFDSDTVSAAVEKTYSDLLELCIPLTPSNVIMYLTVVHREGSFTPLNRLQIMERFIRDLLHRPSDVYRDSFNAENKIDVISAFVFDLYRRGKIAFTMADWERFCQHEMKESMTWFDKDALIKDLEASRVVIRSSIGFVFKYKMYYSYFVGKYVAQRPVELKRFLDQGLHLNLDNLVEIIAGVSKDNVLLIEDLLSRLDSSIRDFDTQYDTKGFDPYVELEWQENSNESKDVWEPVVEKLAAGPASEGEVDRLKRSIVSESRTADQSVVIREFSDAQRSVTFNQAALSGAIRESQRLPGALKLRAMKSIYESYRIIAQIGFLFAPIIATRRFFVWNNVAFYNAMNFKGYEAATEEQRSGMVAGAIPRAITGRAADEIGSRRLGTVFENMIDDPDLQGFGTLMTFTLLLRSKPEGWERLVRRVLDGTDRRALYLRYMLGSAMRQFNQEVNTNAERSALKRTVAVIQAKRAVKKALPNNKAIGRVLQTLEVSRYFERNSNAGTIGELDLAEIEKEADAIEAAAVQVAHSDLESQLDADLSVIGIRKAGSEKPGVP